MSYSLERFGSTTLPAFLPTTDAGSGPSRTRFTAVTSGGVYDGFGAEQAPRAMTEINAKGRIWATSREALETNFYNLRALRGKRDRLYRRRANQAVEWTIARLVEISSTRENENRLYQDVNLRFVMLSPCWYGSRHGDGWVFDAGEFFDTGLVFDEGVPIVMSAPVEFVTLVNSGNAEVANLVLTISGSDAISDLLITADGVELEYSNTIPAGQALVIDCGAKSVKLDGVDDYAHFALGSGHTKESWLPLAPGNNDLTFAFSGGGTEGVSLQAEYSDGWE